MINYNFYTNNILDVCDLVVKTLKFEFGECKTLELLVNNSTRLKLDSRIAQLGMFSIKFVFGLFIKDKILYIIVCLTRKLDWIGFVFEKKSQTQLTFALKKIRFNTDKT